MSSMPQVQPISFITIRRRFDFRSIEIGRWVTEPERDRAAVLFYQALCDLMGLLQAPEKLISLRQNLGLQYGIGGRPGVSAHYIPATRQLALAKNAGAGSLAHEWFHGFDHYIAGKAFPGSPGQTFASKAWINSRTMSPHPLNTLLAECFKAILLNKKGTDPSELFLCSRQADRACGVLYYARPEELAARAFEAFVEDALPHNRFLVSGSRFSREAKEGLYPQGEQRGRINGAFGRYFATLGAALYRQQGKAG
ncbi:CLCA_X family protein [Marinobacter salicampi]|uniref:CLCA_X family protein n=1 Tax=Marinobacter salicampi TaxID=435907 RepID=UPI00140DDC53|nr:CLCA_X family protein [Marinobacter salicampi]